MAYLIDGNNLLGRIAPHELREPSGRDGLVVRLLAFQRVTRARIHLVFDGNPEVTPTDVVVNPKFIIHFPGEGRSADDVIAANDVEAAGRGMVRPVSMPVSAQNKQKTTAE